LILLRRQLFDADAAEMLSTLFSLLLLIIFFFSPLSMLSLSFFFFDASQPTADYADISAAFAAPAAFDDDAFSLRR